jgi:hypothetical protein
MPYCREVAAVCRREGDLLLYQKGREHQLRCSGINKDDHEHARHAGDYRDAAAYCWRSMLHFGIDKSLNGKTASGLLLRQPTKLKYLDQDNHRPDPQRRA